MKICYCQKLKGKIQKRAITSPPPCAPWSGILHLNSAHASMCMALVPPPPPAAHIDGSALGYSAVNQGRASHQNKKLGVRPWPLHHN